jgi:hypothetical protein
MKTTSKLSHNVILSLYHVLNWYQNNKGVPSGQKVLQLYDLWKGLHAAFFNISSKGWKALEELAHRIEESVSIGGEERRWLFLYALETYLNIVIRAITLAKLGEAPENVNSFIKKVTEKRNIFEPNVFEWFFEALNDRYLPKDLRNNLKDSINALFEVMSRLNLLHITTDMFREVYQDILPSEVRKSLGEFYTNDEIVNRVLDAAGLNADAIRELYERWRGGDKNTIILDPACGSGSFLVNVVKRIFHSLEGRDLQKVKEFIENNVIGIDINPFAVEMAKLNLIIAIASEMVKRGGLYIPSELRIYWADSLSKPVIQQAVHGYNKLMIEVPALQRFIEGNKESKESIISIPFCNNIEPSNILDTAIEHVANGKSLEDFMQKATEIFAHSGTSKPLMDLISLDLEKLYRVLEAVYSTGNNRVISLVRNIVAVQSLIGKCSYVIGNPPWVRIHNLDKNVLNYLRKTYKWVKAKDRKDEGIAFNPKFKETKIPFAEQIDYSVVFVERGLEFLKEGGVLSYVITSKITRVTYAGKMREDIVKNYTILEIVDYSLYPVQLFKDVVNYPLIISVKKASPQKGHKVRVTVYNTSGEAKSFEVEQEVLPLYSGTSYLNRDRSPWVLALPEVIIVLKKIINSGYRLGDLYKITRGVETDLNEGYIGALLNCTSAGVVKLSLEGNIIAEIEEPLVYPMVTGEDIDPYSFSPRKYIIFPHDPASLDPLWDVDQKDVLDTFSLLRQGVKVEASGGVLKYITKNLGTNYANIIQNSINTLRSKGYQINTVTPCAVYMCLDIRKPGGDTILTINIEVQTSKTTMLIYNVAGLRIPNAPKATQHFITLLEKLIKRSSYRADLPPWTIFAVFEEKFKEYRIAWQEIAKHIEATHLPVTVNINMCGTTKQKLLIPIQKVYFIVEKDPLKALKLLIYMNSDLARNLIKLWAWTSRGGYYEHTSYTMGMLPIPKALVNDTLWSFLNKLLEHPREVPDLNSIARELLKNVADKLWNELINSLGISKEEYAKLIEYGKWLNELKAPQEEEIEEAEEEEG